MSGEEVEDIEIPKVGEEGNYIYNYTTLTVNMIMNIMNEISTEVPVILMID